MDVIFSLVLIALGGLAAQDAFKPLKKLFSKLEPYASGIGIAGLIFGVVWTCETIGFLRHIGHYPLQFLIFAIYSALLLSLSLIFSYEILKTIIGVPSPKIVIKAGEWREKLLPHKDRLGLAGFALGLFLIAYKFT